VVLVAVPLVGAFLGPAFVRKRDLWLPLGPADKITKTPQAFDFRYRETDGWRQSVVRRTAYALLDGGDIVVLSNICTHLGCAVRWDPSRNLYVCPCHGGLFDREGKVIPGTPPPRPLQRYRRRVHKGMLEIEVITT
jgi:menaquinol-cytochrome c reductase iron-sulfur subunit